MPNISKIVPLHVIHKMFVKRLK